MFNDNLDYDRFLRSKYKYNKYNNHNNVFIFSDY